MKDSLISTAAQYNRPFISAFWRGHITAQKGKPLSANPYPDHPQRHKNRVTFSRAWRRAWTAGWHAFHDFGDPSIAPRKQKP